jgi:L-ascorbate metabolism protein UlaG (beta-lactamase superfamily)
LRFVGHSTVRLELAGHVVLTDPVLTDRVAVLRRVTRSSTSADRADVDLVLLSHLHGDHVHLPSLRLLSPHVRVVVPRGAGDWLRSRGIRRVDELAPGEELEHGDLRITGVPAEHSGHRWGPRSTRGPQAVAMGHLIEGADQRVYAAGDTDLFPEMAALADVDVALLPVWGWGPTLGPGHLTPARAAEAVALLRPKVAVPVHWGTLALAGLPRAPGCAGC